MENYKWIKTSTDVAELRREDFSSIPSLKLNKLDPLLMEKLEERGVDYFVEGGTILGECYYVLMLKNINRVKITAPLYQYNVSSCEYKLITNSYTQITNDPNEYEILTQIYLECCEKIKKEQLKKYL